MKDEGYAKTSEEKKFKYIKIDSGHTSVKLVAHI